MSKIGLISLVVLSSLFSNAAHAGYVRGHYRNDGTYVNGYNRTNPNNSRFDNYSTQGNYNPYTGEVGTVDPYNQY